MPLPALIVAAQEIEIKGFFFRHRARASTRALDLKNPETRASAPRAGAGRSKWLSQAIGANRTARLALQRRSQHQGQEPEDCPERPFGGLAMHGRHRQRLSKRAARYSNLAAS